MIDNDVEDIGLQLKTQREKLGYSLQDVAQSTNIRKIYLENIEKNQFSELPGQAYVTGFVKAYARYLGADDSALLEQLAQLRMIDGPPTLKPFNAEMLHPERLGKPSARPIPGLLVLAGLVAIALCLAIYFLTPLFKDQTPVVTVPSRPASVAKQPTASQAVDKTKAEKEPGQGQERLSVAEESPSASRTLPSIPTGGASLRMLALSEGSLIIYIDGRDSRLYDLRNGLELLWDVKESVKVELNGPDVASFWLGDQPLEIDQMKSFHLQTVSGD